MNKRADSDPRVRFSLMDLLNILSDIKMGGLT